MNAMHARTIVHLYACTRERSKQVSTYEGVCVASFPKFGKKDATAHTIGDSINQATLLCGQCDLKESSKTSYSKHATRNMQSINLESMDGRKYRERQSVGPSNPKSKPNRTEREQKLLQLAKATFLNMISSKTESMEGTNKWDSIFVP